MINIGEILLYQIVGGDKTIRSWHLKTMGRGIMVINRVTSLTASSSFEAFLRLILVTLR